MNWLFIEIENKNLSIEIYKHSCNYYMNKIFNADTDNEGFAHFQLKISSLSYSPNILCVCVRDSKPQH